MVVSVEVSSSYPFMFCIDAIGWHDGSIRCTDSAGRVKWFLPTAHRDGTNTISHHVITCIGVILKLSHLGISTGRWTVACST